MKLIQHLLLINKTVDFKIMYGFSHHQHRLKAIAII